MEAALPGVVVFRGLVSADHQLPIATARAVSTFVAINKPPRIKHMMRVGFEPTPVRTRSLVWRLRPLGHLTMKPEALVESIHNIAEP